MLDKVQVVNIVIHLRYITLLGYEGGAAVLDRRWLLVVIHLMHKVQKNTEEYIFFICWHAEICLY